MKMPEREGALAEEQIVRSIQSGDVRISKDSRLTCPRSDPVKCPVYQVVPGNAQHAPGQKFRKQRIGIRKNIYDLLLGLGK